MRFRRIKFHNYRCFRDGELIFSETENQNINLVLGNNGAGKTEMLFAFWWVLYGFNFHSLKNKEASPYALNQTLYKSIVDGLSEQEECYIESELEDNNTIYIIKRTAIYTKVQKNVATSEKQEIRYYKSNYELSLPIRDEAEVNKILTRILPKPILNGIVFDGERMKQLSSLDDNSAKAIAGVINDITNVELYEQCKITFEQVQKSLSKKAKQIAKQEKDVSLNTIINEIDDLQKKVNNLAGEKKELTDKIAELKRQRNGLSLQLDDIKEARLLEKQRKDARTDLNLEQTKKESTIHSFTTSIAEGYLTCCGPLFDDVEQLLVDYDVPAELTVQAAQNILGRATCICGTPWTEEMISEIKSLIRKLPPDNINSAMGEKVHQLRISSEDKKKAIKNDYDLLNESNERIKGLKERIASLSTQIANSGSDAANEIEQAYQKVQDEIIKDSARLQNIETNLPLLEKDLEAKKKQKAALAQGYQETIKLEKENNYIEKCIVALEKIKDTNRLIALNQINQRLENAYSILGNDYAMGRRIYLVKYDQVKRYQIVTYSESQYQATIKSMIQKGIAAALKANGQSDEEIQETAILSCALPNSTGQSKINTLSFVKAILDFAHDPQNEVSFDTGKSYPLLIDAPFGDVFDENLDNSAKHLHSFTHQIILMLAKGSYENVEQFIAPYVGSVHVLEVEPHKGYSTIHTAQLGGI